MSIKCENLQNQQTFTYTFHNLLGESVENFK